MPEQPLLLRDLTTLRLGGPADDLITATTEAEVVEAVRRADTDGTSVLVLAGGSNVVVGDEGFRGTVVQVGTRGTRVESDEEDTGASLAVAAGEPWDEVVATAVDNGWTGVEALSGIPGSSGGTPIQNVGAYGQEVAQTIDWVRTWDREEGALRRFAGAECGFGYRTSRFKAEPGRYVVLEVGFVLPRGELGAPVQYVELARALDVGIGERAPLAEVRDAVVGLRRAKGMVLDPADHDTWSAGSFFTNPVVSPGLVPQEAPTWAQGGLVKVSAAWLIEATGYGKGYTRGAVGLSGKHSLALTNRGDATTAELLALAVEIRDAVRIRFGIELVNEPVLVGCSLP